MIFTAVADMPPTEAFAAHEGPLRSRIERMFLTTK
jgi:hypothetical protein